LCDRIKENAYPLDSASTQNAQTLKSVILRDRRAAGCRPEDLMIPPGLRHGYLRIHQPQRYEQILSEWIRREHHA